MNNILTTNYIRKFSAQYDDQPGFINRDIDDQPETFNKTDRGLESKEKIIERWKKPKKLKREKIYQLGVDIPSVDNSYIEDKYI